MGIDFMFGVIFGIWLLWSFNNMDKIMFGVKQNGNKN